MQGLHWVDSIFLCTDDVGWNYTEVLSMSASLDTDLSALLVFPRPSDGFLQAQIDFAWSNRDAYEATYVAANDLAKQAAFALYADNYSLYDKLIKEIRVKQGEAERIEQNFRDLIYYPLENDDADLLVEFSTLPWAGMLPVLILDKGMGFLSEDYKLATSDNRDGDDNELIGDSWEGATIFYYDGNDKVVSEVSNGSIGFSMGLGDDLFVGGNANEIVVGDDGSDTLWGGGGSDVIDGASGDDLIRGGLGNDILGGGEGVDVIKGDEGNDLIFGEEGDDLLTGGSGDDKISGGPGYDIAFYEGPKSRYFVSYSITGSEITVSDQDSSRDGTDILSEVELLLFSDGETVDLPAHDDDQAAPADDSNSSEGIMDFSGDGVVDTNDSLLMMRFMMGTFPGDAIIQGIPGVQDSASIFEKISKVLDDTSAMGGGNRLDIDGDGFVNPFSDGMLIVNHIHGNGEAAFGELSNIPAFIQNPTRSMSEMHGHLVNLIGF